jgi:hypothetical protein
MLDRIHRLLRSRQKCEECQKLKFCSVIGQGSTDGKTMTDYFWCQQHSPLRDIKGIGCVKCGEKAIGGEGGVDLCGAVFFYEYCSLEHKAVLLGELKKAMDSSLGRRAPRICVGCKKIEADKHYKLCSRCKTAYYCTVECQKADWGIHKDMCSTSKKT